MSLENSILFPMFGLTGLVRDKLGRKMSKQLGNSPDASGLIDNYGADAVRVGLMLALLQEMISYLMKAWSTGKEFFQ